MRLNTTIGLIAFLLICLAPVESSCQKVKTEFTDFDTNGDGKLSGTELVNFNTDFIDHVDKDIDWSLNENEFKAYNNFSKRIDVEREFIPKDAKIFKDIAYVENGHHSQKFDIYFPGNYKSEKPLPLVIWIHGGGWKGLTKEDFGKQAFLLEHGFAVASINYRLSRYAIFPAQIYDTKAAVRNLRKNAKVYNINPDKIGVWGSSAGGHLAALVGTSGDVTELEGNIGVTDVSSSVQAVCDWFGPSDMVQIVKDLRAQGDKWGMPNIEKLLGGTIEEKMELAKQSSPIEYVSNDDPPFLIMQGDEDVMVPLNQSVLLDKKLKEANVKSELIIIEGAGHAFFTKDEELNKVAEFFKSSLMDN